MGVHNIRSKDDFYKVVNGELLKTTVGTEIPSKKVAVLDCFATWCGPCKAISPLFEKLSEDEKNANINFLKIDVDEVPDLSQELGIRAMPTFMVFQNGEKVDEVVGANPPALQKVVAQYAEAA